MKAEHGQQARWSLTLLFESVVDEDALVGITELDSGVTESKNALFFLVILTNMLCYTDTM